MSRGITRLGAVALVGIAVVISLFVLWRVAPESLRGGRPNFVVIQIDTLRADHVGCYGYSRPTTPNLDRFARQGLQFRNAYSVTSWTLPAVASLLTGLRPSRHGVRAVGDLLPDSIPTLAHELQATGYHTGAISANFAFVIPSRTYPKPPLHLGQGFDTFEVLGQQADTDDREAEIWLHTLVRTVRADVVTAKMQDFIRARHEPFFLFAVYIDPHYGYDPPGTYATMFEPSPLPSTVTGALRDVAQLVRPLSAADVAHLRNLYDGEVRYTDEHLGNFLQALDDSGLAERTVVVILSDHGEAFLDHGRMVHGQDLYEEVVHIPLLVRGPHIPRGTVDQLVSIADVMPTILDLVGLPVPSGLDGRSLTPTWRTPPPQDQRSLVFELDKEPRLHSRALREEEWKLIASTDGKLELYDIDKDPSERHDVAEGNGAAVSRLASALAQHPAPTPVPQSRPTLTDAEKERLTRWDTPTSVVRVLPYSANHLALRQAPEEFPQRQHKHRPVAQALTPQIHAERPAQTFLLG